MLDDIRNFRSIFGVIPAYILVQLLFSGAYYYLYTSNPSNFYFNSEIKESQDVKYIAELHIAIKKAEEELSFLDSAREINSTRQEAFRELISKAESMIESGFNINLFMNSSFPISFGDRYCVITRQREFIARSSAYLPHLIIFKKIGSVEIDVALMSLKPVSYEGVKAWLMEKSELNRDYVEKNIQRYKDEIKHLESDIFVPRSFEFSDFIYFGLTFVSHSDILPNSTTVRSLVVLQRIIELLLLIVMVNIVTIIYSKKSEVTNQNR